MKSFLVHQTINRKNLDKSFKRILRTRPIRKHQEKKKKKVRSNMTRSCCCSCCCSNFSAKLKENNLVSSLHVFSFSVYLPLSLYLSHPVSPSISLWLYLSTSVCLSIPVYVCLRRYTSLCFCLCLFLSLPCYFLFFSRNSMFLHLCSLVGFAALSKWMWSFCFFFQGRK